VSLGESLKGLLLLALSTGSHFRAACITLGFGELEDLVAAALTKGAATIASAITVTRPNTSAAAFVARLANLSVSNNGLCVEDCIKVIFEIDHGVCS
jgi:hypothetical protein